jgi:CRISPR-associated protein Cas1
MTTLYVTEQGVQVHKKGQRLIAQKGEEILQDIPMIKIDRVVLMGSGVSLTTPALHALIRKNVDILYLTGRGGFVSRVVGREHKHSRLRYAQALSITNPDLAFTIAKSIVQGKINNQRVLVQRHAEGNHWAKRAIRTMNEMKSRVDSAQNLDELRGLEGMAAKEYFGLLRNLFHPPRDGQSWRFDRREYYPPPDPINALLSFGYTLLLNDLVAACQKAGLDPDLGFFHSIDYGKPSMALDLEEEFRPIIVDSIILTVINRPLFGLQDFEIGQPRQQNDQQDDQNPPRIPVLLRDDARKRFINLYETRINEQIFYPPTGETTSYRRIFELQAYQMARVILGETPEYIPLIVR